MVMKSFLYELDLLETSTKFSNENVVAWMGPELGPAYIEVGDPR